jgi:hypothetical protein
MVATQQETLRGKLPQEGSSLHDRNLLAGYSICGIVGLLAFVAPDFATRQLVFCLAKWKSLQIKRARLNDLKLFALVTRLHARKRDRYIFVIMSSQIVAAIAIVNVGIASLVCGLLESTDILTKLIHLNIRFAESVIIAFVKLMISVAVFALVVSFSIRLFQRQRSIQRKLVNYEQYRRDVIHRWGKEEVSRVEAEL